MTKTQNALRSFSLLIALSAALSLSASLPAAWGDPAASAFPSVPEANWVGMRFVILPQSKAVQHYGYQELYRDADKDFAPLPYADFAGRIIRIVGIDHASGPEGKEWEEAELQLEGDKSLIHGDIDHGCMTDVGPAADLETARRLYLGKTLWLASDHLSTYNAEEDTSDLPTSPAWHKAFQEIPVKQFSPVKVLDVVPGWYASSPVRFVVQSEGSGAQGHVQGYVDVHMSNTNIPASLQAVDRFESIFLESDPRINSSWSPKIWTALENKEVLLGMTAPQVRMSWGEPKEIRTLPGQTNVEQWVYGPASILTLKDGVLDGVSSQTLPATPPAPAR